jgi:uncharacterized Zn finger protein
MAWFTDSDLRRLAGPASYERGVGYVTAVGHLDDLADGAAASVAGTDTYEVRLRKRHGRLEGTCTCPYGQDGNFCKHCVAVGLALLAAAGAPTRRRTTIDLRGYLTSVEPAILVDLLLDLAADDPALYRKLSLRAATHGVPGAAQLRRLVAGLRSRGYLEYSQSFGYARKANDILDAVDAVAEERPELAGPLYRAAIIHLTKATEQADDSAGAIGASLDRAVAGYAAACRVAPPDPVELATWIVDFQVDGPGWPEIAIGDFAEALGRTGLAAYRKKLDEAAGRDSLTVRHLREDYLKTISGDTDALVAHYAEDLPTSYGYVRIGTTLRDAGRYEEAIAWMRRGLAEADRPDSRIDLLLADLLTTVGRPEEAVEVQWKLFADYPGLDAHRRLLDAAERASTLAVTADRACDLLRQRAALGGRHAGPLVTVLLAAGDIDGAWRAANRYQCDSELLFTVAVQRAETHPADAIPILARRVDDLIDRKTRPAYAEAAQLLADLRALHGRTGGDFGGYLEALKATHRRKSALKGELTRAGL